VRTILCLIALSVGCGKSKSADPATGSAGSTAATSGAPTATSGAKLAMDHVTLLHPEADIEARVADQAAFTTAFSGAIKSATDFVIAYDGAHAGVLPASLDVLIVARAPGARAWVVGASGDIAVPGLEALIAGLPKLPIKDGNVAAAATLQREGAASAERGPYLPAAWKAAAASGGSEMDQVIDKAWPR
jgi:hypothetical protein